MIGIYIDTQAIMDEFYLDKKQIEGLMDYTVKEVTAGLAKEWENQAKKALHSTRDLYVNNIHIADPGKFQGAIFLTGKMPNMIEQGASAFDMKEGFKQSAKKKQKKGGGWYMTIPFRYATPGALGENSVFAGSLPDEVYAVAKTQATNIPIPGAKRSAGLKIEDLPQQYQAPSIRPGFSTIPESKTFVEYKTKTAQFQGLVKINDNATGQNRYMTFRRISDTSDPSAWIHPGFDAMNLAEKAIDAFNMDLHIDKAIDNYLSKLGFGS